MSMSYQAVWIITENTLGDRLLLLKTETLDGIDGVLNLNPHRYLMSRTLPVYREQEKKG